MHLTSSDGYLIPNLDESFDRLAVEQCRSMMGHYNQAPNSIKSLLEGIAIWQQVENNAGPGKPTTPTNVS